MFAVLVIDRDANFIKRRRLFRTPQVRDVRVYGGLPFRAVTTALRHSDIDRTAVSQAAGRCAGCMLLPSGIAQGGGIAEPDLSDYSRLLFFNTACDVLREALGCGLRGRLCISDRTASAAGRLSLAVPIISDIRIVTDCPKAYKSAAERAMEEFGASVVVADEPAQSDILIDLDSPNGSGELTLRSGSITASGINLPSAYMRLMPQGTDALKFAAALYEISRIYSLANLRFEKLFYHGSSITEEQASQLVRDVTQLQSY